MPVSRRGLSAGGAFAGYAEETMRSYGALLIEKPEEIFARVWREIRPHAAPPAVSVEFRRFANASSRIRLNGGRLEAKLSDAFCAAPAYVVESLAHILISKLARKPLGAAHRDRYRRYLNRADVRRAIDALRKERGWKLIEGPQGRTYDLVGMYEDLNVRFFGGMMARPALGWSKRASRTTLGHYDPSHHAIVMSCVLDRPGMPRLAVEYVLYHEMLHLRFPEEHRGARRCVHTAEFKAAEREFPGWEEARKLLRTLG